MGECFFWYQLTRVVPDKIQRAVKWLCVCVILLTLQILPFSLLLACHYVQFSCLAFLLLYAIILLTDFHPYPAIGIKEYILNIWIFSLVAEEIRQVFFRIICILVDL